MLFAPVEFDHVPSAHGIARPAEHQYPAWQLWHSSMLLSPVLLPTVPLGQGVGAELPMLQKEDTMQVSQDVALSAPWYVPAGHWMGSDALPTQ